MASDSKTKDRTPPAPPSQRAAALREYYRRNFREFGQRELKIRPMYIDEENGSGLIPLILTESQELCYQRVEEQRKVQGYVRGACLKPRQSGFSTLWEAILFWLASLNAHISTLLIAADSKSTNAIFRMAHLMYENLSSEVQPQIRYMNKEELDFRNPEKYQRGNDVGLDSRMEFQTAKNAIAGTGTTRQALHMSEVGKWPEALTDDLATSLMPSVQRRPGTYIVLESTAFEGGDYFHEMCEEAEDAEKRRFKGDATGGGFDYFFHFAPWWVDTKNSVPLLPGEEIELDPTETELQRYAEKVFPKEYKHLRIGPRTITPEQFKFRRLEIISLKGEKNWEQEYPRSPEAAWINRDRWAFDRPTLHKQRSNLCAPKELVTIESNRFYTQRERTNVFKDMDYIAIWKRPEEGHTYDIGIDTAMGTDGGDWTYGVVLDRKTREQVAEYHKHMPPIDSAREFFGLGRIYNTAQLIVEMNVGPGLLLNTELETMGYPYLYTWRNFNRIGQALTSYTGWETNFKSKKYMVGVSADYLLHERAIIRSKVLFDELALYVNIGQDEYRGARGTHDDGCVAFMIAIIGGHQEGATDPGVSTLPKEEKREPNWSATHDKRNPQERRVREATREELRELTGMR